jgi:hypothetical protein
MLGGLLRNISSRTSLERAFTLIVFLIPLSPSIFIGGGKWSVNLALEESAHNLLRNAAAGLTLITIACEH